ncbi:unnamed protein product [Zymoseptoria tritici ST99CH_3D1]|uniref:Uncharacterized protein n=2 Tax=Zymoseptoria tritici TaxID=1047171 RepID=A0A1X7RWX7_ZYMT9|nr:unnamed protein product [Zymoseptoria tritici ST99CH_3D7]SMR53988.1 unnamed protein product [Zymoseptoria tritici ST99CH_1E4]SMR56179.1 unnamed protein product [Zymoseptoria tritici ST99CH_3D1]
MQLGTTFTLIFGLLATILGIIALLAHKSGILQDFIVRRSDRRQPLLQTPRNNAHHASILRDESMLWHELVEMILLVFLARYRNPAQLSHRFDLEAGRQSPPLQYALEEHRAARILPVEAPGIAETL